MFFGLGMIYYMTSSLPAYKLHIEITLNIVLKENSFALTVNKKKGYLKTKMYLLDTDIVHIQLLLISQFSAAKESLLISV